MHTLLTEPPGAVCQRCRAAVPYRTAKLVLAFGMCCLDCLPVVTGPGHHVTPRPATAGIRK